MPDANYLDPGLLQLLFPKFAPEDLIHYAISKSITARKSIEKHTKADNSGLLSYPWLLF